jgi:hypothetical protein
MKEYYIVANSKAAPFVSDTSEHWWNGISPHDALKAFIKEYKHPAGLYSANLYIDANAKAKGKKPILCWLDEIGAYVKEDINA